MKDRATGSGARIQIDRSWRFATCSFGMRVGRSWEEIPAGFANALVLRAGQVVAAGPLANVISDEVLSQAFDLPIEVSRNDGRAWARMRR